MSYLAFEDCEKQRSGDILKKLVRKRERKELQQQRRPKLLCGNFTFIDRDVIPELKRKKRAPVKTTSCVLKTDKVFGLNPIPPQVPIPEEKNRKSTWSLKSQKSWHKPAKKSIHDFSKQLNPKRKGRHRHKKKIYTFNGKRNVELENRFLNKNHLLAISKPTKLLSTNPGVLRKPKEWKSSSPAEKFIDFKVKTRKHQKRSNKTKSKEILCFLQTVIVCQFLIHSREKLHDSASENDKINGKKCDNEMVENNLHIWINNEGEWVPISISEESTVTCLKQNMQKNITEVGFYYKIKCLDNEKKLSDYGIRSNEVIHVKSLTRGGAPGLQQKKFSSLSKSSSSPSTSTKSYSLQQYSNINLNNGNNSITLYPSSVQSYTKPIHSAPATFYNDDENKKSAFSTKSFSSGICPRNKLNLEVEKETRKDWKKDKRSSNTSNSTLSLHISAYENSMEPHLDDTKTDFLSKKKGATKADFFLMKKALPDLVKTWQEYEFPRQQDDNHASDPEVMQFKASQKLFNPSNESGVPSAKVMRLSADKLDKSLNIRETVASKSSDSSDANISSSSLTIKEVPVCYFAIPRSSIYESEDRSPEWTVSIGCEGTLKRLGDLLHTEAPGFPGCSVAELILIRGGSEFDIELSNEHVRRQVANRNICKKHENELGIEWSLKKYNHIILKRTYNQTTRAPVCSMPHGYGEKHVESARPFKVRHSLTIGGSKAFLRETGKFVPPGTPLCQKDQMYIGQLITNMQNANTHGPIDTDMDFDEPQDLHLSTLANDVADSSTCRKTMVAAKTSLHDFYMTNDDDGEPSPSRITQSAVERKRIDDCLYAFAESAGISLSKDVKGIENLCHDSQQRKVKALTDLVKVIAERIAPSNPDKLLELYANSIKKHQMPNKAEKQVESLLNFVKEQYKVAETGRERIAILSQIVAAVSYSTLLQYIPNLSPHYFKTARFEAYRRLEAWTPPISKQIRTSYNREYINLFIEFITSSAVMVGLPYGSRTAKTPDGKTFDIPNTIRKQRDSEVIKMFFHWLMQIGRDDVFISESVLRKILKTCAAHRQHSLYCVDYYEANGKMAFENLFRCLETMMQEYWIDVEDGKELRILLQESKLYLSTDYSLHVKEYSDVPEHCINFALSDPKNPAFRAQKCEELQDHPHSHNHECDRCLLFGKALKRMNAVLEDLIVEGNENNAYKINEIQDEIKKSEEDVLQWKFHILRATFSEFQRLKIIEGLQNNEALIYVDYAQKFLPRYYLERQKDYYGKKGLSWHIAHIDAIINNIRVQHTITHLLSFEEQTAKAVAAIIQDILKKCNLWQIKKVIFRSDNAGYYRNAALLQTIPHLSAESGVEVTRYSLSEVQAGKNPSDRDGAKMKARTKDFQDYGNNILSSDDMFTALVSGAEPLDGLTVVNAVIQDKTSSNLAAIPGISSFSDVVFDYECESLIFWKHFEKGKGQRVPFADERLNVSLQIKEETTETPETESYAFWRTKAELRPKKQKQKTAESTDETVSDEDTEANEETQGRVVITEENQDLNLQLNAPFSCPENNCIQRFRLFSNLMKHVERGNHKLVPEKTTLYDEALKMFVNRLEQVDQQRTDALLSQAFEDFGIRSETEIKEGYCLREVATRKRFSKEVHEFIDNQLAACIRQQKRLDAQECEKSMASARFPSGRLLFSPFERLNASQIASLVKRKLDKMSHVQKSTIDDLNQRREEIDQEIENETGEIEIEYQDDPLFESTFDAIHEYVEEIEPGMPPQSSNQLIQPKKRQCRKKV